MGVLLNQIRRRALQIFAPVLRLAETHQVFTVVGAERRFELEAARGDGLELAWRRAGEVASGFGQKFLAGLGVEIADHRLQRHVCTQPAGQEHSRFDPPVPDAGVLAINGNFSVESRRVE